MQHNLDDIVSQSAASFMKINSKETKEMQIGAGMRKRPHQELIFEGIALEKVASYKLLELHVTETERHWNGMFT